MANLKVNVLVASERQSLRKSLGHDDVSSLIVGLAVLHRDISVFDEIAKEVVLTIMCQMQSQFTGFLERAMQAVLSSK
eukprot:600945-Rhodomonas_salina.1